jgi:hypothetical protein
MGRQFQVGDRVVVTWGHDGFYSAGASGIVIAKRTHTKPVLVQFDSGVYNPYRGQWFVISRNLEWLTHDGIARALGRGYAGRE